jgi:hypothetical protein
VADVAVRINPDTIRIAVYGVEALAVSVERQMGNDLLRGILEPLTGEGARWAGI